MFRKRQAGFTLIEVLFVVAIVAVLMAFALPALNDFFDKKRLISGAEAVYSELQLARSEAVARSADVYVEFDRDGNTDWDFGMSETENCLPEETDPTVANACFLEIDDGDGVTGEDEDKVLKTTSSTDYVGTNFISQNFSGNQVKFDYVRGTANSGTIILRSDAGLEMKILVSIIGRVRMCSTAGATTKVGGYPDC